MKQSSRVFNAGRKSVRTFAAAATLAALSAQILGAAAYKEIETYVSFESKCSLSTGLEVCAEAAELSGTVPFQSWGGRTYMECPGACPWSSITANPTWTHLGLLGEEDESVRCGGVVNGNATSPGFSCPETALVRGTCIPSPSNGCRYLGVFVSQNWSSSQHGFGERLYNVSCAGPDAETCTWYYDPQCSQIVPPGKAPVADGGVKCVGKPINYSDDTVRFHIQTFDGGWCQEAVDQIDQKIAPTACPPPSPTLTNGCTLPEPTRLPYWTSPWNCMPTCSESGSFVLVRELSTKEMNGNPIQCKGPDDSTCSFYSDSQCTTLAPGEPEPDQINESGAICKSPDSWEWWCNIARKFIPSLTNDYDFNSGKYGCNYTRYTCIEPCSVKEGEYGPYIAVARSEGGTVSCLPNEAGDACYQFEGPTCDGDALQNATLPYGDATDIKCTDESKGWCKDAADVLKKGYSEPDCEGRQGTMTTATATAATTTGQGSIPPTSPVISTAGSPSATATATASATGTAGAQSTRSAPSAAKANRVGGGLVSMFIALSIILLCI